MTRLESYNDPRPSTNQSTSLRVVYLFYRFVLFCFVLFCFVLFWTDGRTDGRTPSQEIMNHFSSLCFGLYLSVDGRGSIFEHCYQYIVFNALPNCFLFILRIGFYPSTNYYIRIYEEPFVAVSGVSHEHFTISIFFTKEWLQQLDDFSHCS